MAFNPARSQIIILARLDVCTRLLTRILPDVSKPFSSLYSFDIRLSNRGAGKRLCTRDVTRRGTDTEPRKGI